MEVGFPFRVPVGHHPGPQSPQSLCWLPLRCCWDCHSDHSPVIPLTCLQLPALPMYQAPTPSAHWVPISPPGMVGSLTLSSGTCVQSILRLCLCSSLRPNLFCPCCSFFSLFRSQPECRCAESFVGPSDLPIESWVRAFLWFANYSPS